MNNTPTPTPETDASRHDLSDYGPPFPCSYGDWVPFDVAERLERERDEARGQRDRLAEALNKYRGQVDNEGNHSAPEALQSLNQNAGLSHGDGGATPTPEKP